jgi:hypothetical protein
MGTGFDPRGADLALNLTCPGDPQGEVGELLDWDGNSDIARTFALGSA